MNLRRIKIRREVGNVESSNLISVIDLKKKYVIGDQELYALGGVDFEVKGGEFISIMGTSGSGKSTLMNIIGCLDRPTSGQYILEGIDIKEKTDDELAYVRNRKIGFVFQSFNLISRVTALSNVELPMVYAKYSKEERMQRARELLNQVGLSNRMDHMPNELSGGQRQRVAIARALANDPPIILADEPTGNLDSRSSIEIMEIFSKLNEAGKTVIIVTHEEDIASYTHRIITFQNGHVLSDAQNNNINRDFSYENFRGGVKEIKLEKEKTSENNSDLSKEIVTQNQSKEEN